MCFHKSHLNGLWGCKSLCDPSRWSYWNVFSFPLWLSADTALDNNFLTQFITIDKKKGPIAVLQFVLWFILLLSDGYIIFLKTLQNFKISPNLIQVKFQIQIFPPFKTNIQVLTWISHCWASVKHQLASDEAENRKRIVMSSFCKKNTL